MQVDDPLDAVAGTLGTLRNKWEPRGTGRAGQSGASPYIFGPHVKPNRLNSYIITACDVRV